ncbi:DoxX family protein [uncultured Hymenobacter sp.]|uniref:DoxX family protein n=1 Tax=uncultured Hymenobacter sp. TaxID=170016 RepID=UPI0035CACEEA
MKKLQITYWAFTSLLVALMTASAIPDLVSAPEAVVYFKHLGYPAYLLPFLGVAKLLGAVAVLVPGFPRVKEWAYAGFFFDLTGALYSHVAAGYPASQWAPITIGLLLVAGSYLSYHRKTQAKGNELNAANQLSLIV